MPDNVLIPGDCYIVTLLLRLFNPLRAIGVRSFSRLSGLSMSKASDFSLTPLIEGNDDFLQCSKFVRVSPSFKFCTLLPGVVLKMWIFEPMYMSRSSCVADSSLSLEI